MADARETTVDRAFGAAKGRRRDDAGVAARQRPGEEDGGWSATWSERAGGYAFPLVVTVVLILVVVYSLNKGIQYPAFHATQK